MDTNTLKILQNDFKEKDVFNNFLEITETLFALLDDKIVEKNIDFQNIKHTCEHISNRFKLKTLNHSDFPVKFESLIYSYIDNFNNFNPKNNAKGFLDYPTADKLSQFNETLIIRFGAGYFYERDNKKFLILTLKNLSEPVKAKAEYNQYDDDTSHHIDLLEHLTNVTEARCFGGDVLFGYRSEFFGFAYKDDIGWHYVKDDEDLFCFKNVSAIYQVNSFGLLFEDNDGFIQHIDFKTKRNALEGKQATWADLGWRSLDGQSGDIHYNNPKNREGEDIYYEDYKDEDTVCQTAPTM